MLKLLPLPRPITLGLVVGSGDPIQGGHMRLLASWMALIPAVAALCGGCGGGGSSATIKKPVSLLDACPARSPLPSASGSIASIVDSLVVAEMKAKGLPGMSIEIAKQGTVIYSQGYGYADLGSCRTVQADTEFQIGSLTKQFTAAAVLQMEKAGVVNLDTAVAQYLPSYAFDQRITVRMLLNQTSGLDDYLGFPKPTGWTNGLLQQTVLTAIVQAPLLFPPGTAYAYSNSNYYVLGAVTEAATGTTYADYVTSHIFQPANLTRTSFNQALTAALPYTYTNPSVAGTTGLAVGIVPDASVFFSAGNLWSNVHDLAILDMALRAGTVLPAVQWTEMTTPPASVPVFQQSGASSTYAMGWQAETVGVHPFVWHNGQTLAYTSFNGMFLDDGWSIAILTNVDIQEPTPLLDFAHSVIAGICANAATTSSC